MVLTKSEAATLDAGGEPVLMQRILPRLVSAEARRWPTLEFDVHSMPDMPPVLAEQTYVEQIMRNLLTNAAKYGGARGRVEVLGELDGDEVIVRVLIAGLAFRGRRSAAVRHLLPLATGHAPSGRRRDRAVRVEGARGCDGWPDLGRGAGWRRCGAGFALHAVIEPGDDEELADVLA